jgi:hypothetical protein
MIYPIRDKLKCFYSILTISSVLYQKQLHQCRRQQPRRNTARIPSVLGTHTRKSRRPIFIPLNIITPNARNTPNYTPQMSWFSATTSPKSPDGIGRRVGPPRIAPIRMLTSMFAPAKNTHYTGMTRFSRISNKIE